MRSQTVDKLTHRKNADKLFDTKLKTDKVKEFRTAVKNGCAKAFLLTASTAPQRTFVRLSERFPCLRVFLNVCSVSKNAFRHTENAREIVRSFFIHSRIDFTKQKRQAERK